MALPASCHGRQLSGRVIGEGEALQPFQSRARGRLDQAGAIRGPSPRTISSCPDAGRSTGCRLSALYGPRDGRSSRHALVRVPRSGRRLPQVGDRGLLRVSHPRLFGLRTVYLRRPWSLAAVGEGLAIDSTARSILLVALSALMLFVPLSGVRDTYSAHDRSADYGGRRTIEAVAGNVDKGAT